MGSFPGPRRVSLPRFVAHLCCIVNVSNIGDERGGMSFESVFESFEIFYLISALSRITDCTGLQFVCLDCLAVILDSAAIPLP